MHTGTPPLVSDTVAANFSESAGQLLHRASEEKSNEKKKTALIFDPGEL